MTRQRHDHWLPKMRRQLSEPDPPPDVETDITLPETNNELKSQPQLDIYSIGAVTLISLAWRGYEMCAVSMADINKALAEKKHTDPATKVPPEYHDLLEVFSCEDLNVLLKRRPVQSQD